LAENLSSKLRRRYKYLTPLKQKILGHFVAFRVLIFGRRKV